MRWWVLIVPGVLWAAPPDPGTEFRVERHAIPGGSELLTVFGRIPDAKIHAPDEGDDDADDAESDSVPLLCVLRDTLGDQSAQNDRLRYVWVLTSARPTLLQRAAAAIPFYYWRAGFAKNPDQRPAPVLDLGGLTWCAPGGADSPGAVFARVSEGAAAACGFPQHARAQAPRDAAPRGGGRGLRRTGNFQVGNWPYFAGSWTWNFVRARHGAPYSRAAACAPICWCSRAIIGTSTCAASIQEAIMARCCAPPHIRYC